VNSSLETHVSATHGSGKFIGLLLGKYGKFLYSFLCNSDMAAINVHLFVSQVQARINFFFCGILERNGFTESM
jgi:hypothetical protein